MKRSDFLQPNLNDGRFFVSPILGCNGSCLYCYIGLRNYNIPHKNMVSVDEIRHNAQHCENFKFGRDGTIISVGAWGDIFPRDNKDLLEYSIQIIVALLEWGNPVQIMSKYSLSENYVQVICNAVKYSGQLLYSTTITALKHWRRIEPNTAAPIERLQTCWNFINHGITTNVLLKPFIIGLTDVEIQFIADLLLKYQIQYCVLGVMYWNNTIATRTKHDNEIWSFFRDGKELNSNHLDCNGEITLNSTSIGTLRPYVDYLRSRGINAFLKSSCVNSNILHRNNPSNYLQKNNEYCIRCGNCFD